MIKIHLSILAITIGDLISIHPKIRLNFFNLQGVRKILGCTFLVFFTLLQGVRLLDGCTIL